MVPELSSGGPFSRFDFWVRRSEMGGPMGLGGYLLTPMSSPGAKDSKTTLSGNEKQGHLFTTQKVQGAGEADMGDGVATVLPREMRFRRGAQNH